MSLGELILSRIADRLAMGSICNLISTERSAIWSVIRTYSNRSVSFSLRTLHFGEFSWLSSSTYGYLSHGFPCQHDALSIPLIHLQQIFTHRKAPSKHSSNTWAQRHSVCQIGNTITPSANKGFVTSDEELLSLSVPTSQRTILHNTISKPLHYSQTIPSNYKSASIAKQPN